MTWLDDLRFRGARVAREIVDRALDALARAQCLEVLDEQVRLERVRMVVVDVLALLKRDVVVCLVVVIVVDDRDAVPEMRLEPVRECGLARARAARNADNRRLQFWNPLPVSYEHYLLSYHISRVLSAPSERIISSFSG